MNQKHSLFTLALAGAGWLLSTSCQTSVSGDDRDQIASKSSEVGLAPGQSALLSGMHDIESAAFIEGATAGADKGWITDLQYIGTSGNPSANCHTAETSAGVSIIQRLDLDGSHSYPDAASLSGYVSSFASFAAACSQIHVWIVGNEPNVTANNSDPASYAGPYADAYVQVRARVHALAGHQGDFVLMSPASPYSPFCICSMHRIIQQIIARGGQLDGFAVHAYTQAQHPSDFGSLVSLVTSNEMNGSADGCGYAFHRQFRIYQDWITAIEGESQGGKPVFITESGNACAPERGNVCYPNQNLGYFQAMYQEIRAYNASHATRVRAVTPYRWTSNDDGTGRDFAIGTRSALQSDLTTAFSANVQAPATCDNNVTVGNTACNPSDPGAQFVCTNPGASSSQQWTRQACPAGQACSGTHCQVQGGSCSCSGGSTFWHTQVPASDTSCGFQVCGGDNQLYTCQSDGWHAAGGSPCNCRCTNGVDSQGRSINPDYTYCGYSVCGADLQHYTCTASGWSAQHDTCH